MLLQVGRDVNPLSPFTHLLSQASSDSSIYLNHSLLCNALDLTKYPEEERLDDALLYARAALRNFQTCGEEGSIHISRTQQLIAEIEQDLKIQGS